MPVNGRTCYFAGGPAQVEVLQSVSNDHQRIASAFQSDSQLFNDSVDDILERVFRARKPDLLEESDASSSVHSAVKVLRRRVYCDWMYSILPHILNLKRSDEASASPTTGMTVVVLKHNFPFLKGIVA